MLCAVCARQESHLKRSHAFLAVQRTVCGFDYESKQALHSVVIVTHMPMLLRVCRFCTEESLSHGVCFRWGWLLVCFVLFCFRPTDDGGANG